MRAKKTKSARNVVRRPHMKLLLGRILALTTTRSRRAHLADRQPSRFSSHYSRRFILPEGVISPVPHLSRTDSHASSPFKCPQDPP